MHHAAGRTQGEGRARAHIGSGCVTNASDELIAILSLRFPKAGCPLSGQLSGLPEASMATRNWLAIVRGARSVAWHAAGRRTLASSASRARERPGTPAAAPPIDAVVRGADDLDRAELLSPGSHALDRALVEQLMHSDEQEAAARDWLHEMQSGKLDPHYERYLDWEAEQLARVRAARAGGGKAGAAGAAGTAQGDGTGGAGGAKVDEASADADAEFDSDAHAPADGPDEVADGAGGAQDDGRLVPRMPIEFMNDFPGELRRDELNSPADRALLEQTAAVHAAEGMPFELSEISHRYAPPALRPRARARAPARVPPRSHPPPTRSRSVARASRGAQAKGAPLRAAHRRSGHLLGDAAWSNAWLPA